MASKTTKMNCGMRKASNSESRF